MHLKGVSHKCCVKKVLETETCYSTAVSVVPNKPKYLIFINFV